MREPAFWSRRGSPLATMLAPAAALYGMAAARRMARPGHAIGLPVICIGNFTLGGAGKTPTALAVGRILAEAGHRPVFLSRGYGGRLRGPVMVDPSAQTADDVGDEPLLLARAAPAIVARDRLAGARAAREAGAGAIVMDDGFQNPALAKNLSIVVVDGGRGIGNGRVFPAGPLRAPLVAQLGHAGAVLVVGEGHGADPLREAARGRGRPLFEGRLVPDPAALAALRERPVLAFAGIGDPDKFFRTLRGAGLAVRGERPFPDHHCYGANEAAALIEQAGRERLTLVTTEKDWVRLQGLAGLEALAETAKPLPVTLQVSEPEVFRALVLSPMKG